MSQTQWARLREDVDCGLRRGAWYRAVSIGQSEVVLDINGQHRVFPLRYVEVSATRPARWTVVSHAGNANVIPSFWAKGYAVCPQCRYRQLPLGRVPSMRCDECDGLFEVAWDQPYLEAEV